MIIIGGILLLILLLLLRVPIGAAFCTIGAVLYIAANGLDPFLLYMKTTPYYLFAHYGFSPLPMFVLMGSLAFRTGLSQELFDVARLWLGHLRGGLGMACLGACGGFGSLCGSSVATAATMTSISYKPLIQAGYAPALAAGTLAAGGTLGFLIPPSIALVLYAFLAEQSILDMFIGSLLPAMVALLLFSATVWCVSILYPGSGGGVDKKAPLALRLYALKKLIPAASIFTISLGGMYGGIFTPTEGAAVGVIALTAWGLLNRSLSWLTLKASLFETAGITGMVFLLILGSNIMNTALAFHGLPFTLANFIDGLTIPDFYIIIGILLVYFLLGCFMDSLSILLVTLPVLLPIVATLNVGLPSSEHVLIWFGILSVIIVEQGLITPPFGLNIFVLKSRIKTLPLRTIYKGTLPFVLVSFLQMAIVLAFPWLVLWFLP